MPLTSRLLRLALPLIKTRTALRGISLGVRVLVHDEVGNVLLVKHTYVPGWHFPGGGVEFGETAAEAASRELKEEGGVLARSAPTLIGLYHNPAWTRGDHVAFFEVEHWEPCLPSWGVEVEAVRFIDPAAFPDDVDGSVLRRLAERKGEPKLALW